MTAKRFLSPREFGYAIGTSESTVKRWVDAGALPATKTEGGHRRIALGDAVQFIRQRGLEVVAPQALGLDAVAAVQHLPLQGSDTGPILLDAFLRGKADVVRGVVQSLYVAGTPVAALCDGPIHYAMEHIGTLWRHEREGIVLEHRATDLCVQAFHYIRSLAPVPGAHAPVAIGGGPAGDIYILPSLMAAAVLHTEGWQAMNLGADTPLGLLGEAADAYDAGLVWLAVTVEQPRDPFQPELRRLAERLERRGRTLVVGGRAWPPSARVPGANAYVGASMAELAAFATGLVHRGRGGDEGGRLTLGSSN